MSTLTLEHFISLNKNKTKHDHGHKINYTIISSEGVYHHFNESDVKKIKMFEIYLVLFPNKRIFHFPYKTTIIETLYMLLQCPINNFMGISAKSIELFQNFGHFKLIEMIENYQKENFIKICKDIGFPLTASKDDCKTALETLDAISIMV